MFLGHYAPCFLAKRVEQAVPLWALFIAAQLLDVFWAIFVFVGIEKVRIVPGFTRTNALDLYYMPYTHSLPGALAWALVAAIGYLLVTRSRRGSVLIGLAVFSHWPLDVLVHRPDMALYDNAAKIGLGLWDHPVLTLAVEGGLLFGSLWLYMAVSRPVTTSARFAMPLFLFAMFGVQAAMAFGPPPPSDKAMAATALFAYAVLASVIAWLERARAPSLRTESGV